MSEEKKDTFKCRVCNYDLQKNDEIIVTTPGRVLQVKHHPNGLITREIRQFSGGEKYAHKKCNKGYKFDE